MVLTDKLFKQILPGKTYFEIYTLTYIIYYLYTMYNYTNYIQRVKYTMMFFKNY